MISFTKNVAFCDPIPQEGIDRAVEVMRRGTLFRYDFPDALAAGQELGAAADDAHASGIQVAMLEQEFGRLLRRRYVIAVNSCGSALFLALRAAGVRPEDEVITNAFTFTAVPSAIVHTGAVPVYVECTDDYVIDLDELTRTLHQHPDATCLVLSYMRGHIPDLDAVRTICTRAGITVIEDCAHSLGARWDGELVGQRGQLACFSTQSYKMLSSGEGGLIATDDDTLAAYCILAAGSYETLYTKHPARPADAVLEELAPQVPNFSLRMSNLTAAVLRPQLPLLNAKIARGQGRHRQLAEVLGSARNIRLPAHAALLERAPDSLQFTLLDLTGTQIRSFLQQTSERGVPLQLFGEPGNARNFRTWRYSYAYPPALPATESVLSAACDLRLPSSLTREDLQTIGYIIKDVLYPVLADHNDPDYPDGLTEHFTGVTDVQSTYDAWVGDYDRQHHDNGWIGLLNHLAYTLEPHLNGHHDDAVILDVGCGTGLLGRELRSYGMSTLHGLDISRKSLDLLAGHKLYKELHCHALGEPLPFPDNSFDTLVSAGVFTRHQVPLDSFAELARILRPGGLFAVALRVEDNGLYETPIRELSTQGVWSEISRERLSALRSCRHDLLILQKPDMAITAPRIGTGSLPSHPTHPAELPSTLSIATASGKGRGVFATTTFAAGDLVHRSWMVRVEPERTIHSVQKDWTLHVRLDDTASWTNHSCAPNTGLIDNAYGGYDFIALTTIHAGEEITWDYETTEYESIAVPHCLCGTTQCRGRTRGFKYRAYDRRSPYTAAYLRTPSPRHGGSETIV